MWTEEKNACLRPRKHLYHAGHQHASKARSVLWPRQEVGDRIFHVRRSHLHQVGMWWPRVQPCMSMKIVLVQVDWGAPISPLRWRDSSFVELLTSAWFGWRYDSGTNSVVILWLWEPWKCASCCLCTVVCTSGLLLGNACGPFFFYSSRNIIAYIMYYFSSMYAIICRACLTHRQDTSCKPAIMPYGHGDGRIVVYETTSTVLEVGEEIILHSCKSINGGDKSLSTWDTNGPSSRAPCLLWIFVLTTTWETNFG